MDGWNNRGVVAILDLGNAVGSRAGGGCGRGSPSALGIRRYYPRKIFENLNVKSCDLVHILCCKCHYNSISYHNTCAGNALRDILTLDMRTQEQSSRCWENHNRRPTVKLILLQNKKEQESRAVARKPRDAAAVLFSLKFADNIQYQF